jgi:hypothetical protein
MCTTHKKSLAFGPPVGLAKGYWLDDRVSFPDMGQIIFPLFHTVQTDSGAKPAFYLMGTGE